MSLSSLPPVITRMILQYSLFATRTIQPGLHISTGSTTSSHPSTTDDPLPLQHTKGTRQISPQLLRVCKTIYDEAVEILYREKVFRFVLSFRQIEYRDFCESEPFGGDRLEFWDFEDIFTRLDPKHIRMIRHVQLNVDQPQRWAAIREPVYSKYDDLLANFAALFLGNKHAPQSFEVLLSEDDDVMTNSMITILSSTTG